MKHEKGTKEQLAHELVELCQRIAHMEQAADGLAQSVETVRESEERYRSLFEHIPTGLYRTTQEGQIIDANPALAKMFRFPDLESLLGVNASELYLSPDERYKWLGAKEDQEAVRDLEIPMRRQDGTTMWVRDNSRTVRDANGHILYHEGSLEDITERKCAEEALRESERQYRTLVETLQEGLIMVDPDENILLANQAFSNITGYTKEELCAMNMSDMVPEEDFFRILHETAKRKKGVASTYEIRVIRKDGDLSHISISASPWTNEKGQFQWAVAVMLDITERVRARNVEEAIHRIAQAALATTALEAFYRSIHEVIGTLMSADNFFIALYDADKEMVSFPYFVDQLDPHLEPRPLGRSLTDHVLRTGTTICADSRLLAELENVGKIHRHGTPAQAWLGVPLKNENRTYGALVVQIYDNGATYTEEHKGILEFVSTQVALAIARKSAIESLRQSEEKYRTLTENLNVGVYRNTMGPKGRFIEANPALINMFSYASKEEFLSMFVCDMYQDPQDRALFNEKMLNEGFVREEELKLKTKNGSPLIGSVSAVAVKADDGSVRFYDGVLEDITERKKAEELQQTFERLRKTLEGTVHALAATAETTDPYTAGHQHRVAQLATAIARRMGLEDDRIEGINVAGTLHDIGKIYVPPAILSRPGKLVDIEFSMIKAHPAVGHDILKTVEFPWPIAEVVLKHHERLDGSGYPQGLSGDEIPLEARILGVADVVEAMSSHRPYRPALGLEFAIEEISKNRGKLYDEEVVDACIAVFEKDGFEFK